MTERIEKTETAKRRRNPALDIIRICAFTFVVSVHFFLKCGYYDTPLSGMGMCLATFLRAFFMICVPLFMLLTGYLTADRTPCKAYYCKLVDTLGVYLLASLCCTACKLYAGIEEFWLYHIVSSVLDYSAAPYAWYVEMYIGLFLLCPFLNAGYQALGSKREKRKLLAVLVILAALPQVVNIYRPWLSWFRAPGSSDNYFQFLPDYWTGLYPILYYFLGSYMREYGFPLSPLHSLLLGIALTIFQGFFNIWRSYGATFRWGSWQDYGSAFVMAQAVLFFGMILNLDLTRLPEKVCRLLARISGLCFGAYLVSYIFDAIFYRKLNAAIAYVPHRFPYFVVGVPLICVCSLALSFLINRLYALLKRGSLLLWRRARSKRLQHR